MPKGPLKRPIVLSPAQVVRFLACVASTKHRTILTTIYASGLRVSEAVALRPADIDSSRMVLRVDQGKGRKDRYMMLSPRLLEVLRDYWRIERPWPWLFPGDGAHHEERRRAGLPEGAAPPASTSPSHRTRCDMPLPPTCWSRAPTYVASSCCWAPRRAT
jgi:integrase